MPYTMAALATAHAGPGATHDAMQPAQRSSSSMHDEGDEGLKGELAHAMSEDAPARVPSRLGPEPCWTDGLQQCPVFRPTREEFKDPVAYIESKRDEIAAFGMAKIAPPVAVSTGCVDALRSHKLPVQQQVVRRFVWENFDKPRQFAYQLRTMSAFAKVADSVLNKAFRTTLAMPANTIETEYWRHMSVSAEQHGDALTVECASDIHESGFRDLPDDPFMGSAWNLRHVSTAPGSCLSHTPGAAATPAMALGMLFSTSNWCLQDANLWALSYLHAGGSKTWYSVAAANAEAFEAAMPDLAYPAAVAKMRAEGASAEDVHSAVLRTISRRSTSCCPADVMSAGVPVARCVQRPGEFVVTGARVHYCTLSHAANVSELARLAPRSWLEYGADAMLRCAVLNAPPSLPFERLTAAEMMAFAATLAQKAPAGTSMGTEAFNSWLEANATDLISSADAPLVVTFCRLVMWHHRRVAALKARGALVAEQAFEGGIACSRSGEIAHFAVIVADEAAPPLSLRSHMLQEKRSEGGADDESNQAPDSLSMAVVFVHDRFGTYVEIAKRLCKLCYDKGWARIDEDAWRQQGLTDRLNLPTARTFFVWEDLTKSYDWPALLPEKAEPSGESGCGTAVLPRPIGAALETLLSAALPAEAPIIAGVSNALKEEGGRVNGGKRVGGKQRVRKQSARHVPTSKESQLASATPATLPIAATPSKSAASVKEASGSVSKRKKGADRSPAAEPSVTDAPDAATSMQQEPTKRTARASAVSAMANWKQSIITDEEDSYGSDDDARTNRRGKRAKREEHNQPPPIAPLPGKPGDGLAHVYSSSGLQGLVGANGLVSGPDAAALNTHGMHGANGMALRGQMPGHAAGLAPAPAGGSLFASPGGSGAPGGQHGGMWAERNAGAFPVRPNSAAMSGGGSVGGSLPPHLGGMRSSSAVAAAASAASRGGAGGYREKQPLWLHRSKELHVMWLKQLHRSQGINGELDTMRSYFSELPPVQNCFPASSEATRLDRPTSGMFQPQPGGSNGNGLPQMVMASSGNSGLHGHLPNEHSLVSDLSMGNSVVGAASIAQRRGPPASVGPGNPMWRGARNSGGNKASLHNGPISAQDLATGMREREGNGAAAAGQERPANSDEGSKGAAASASQKRSAANKARSARATRANAGRGGAGANAAAPGRAGAQSIAGGGPAKMPPPNDAASGGQAPGLGADEKGTGALGTPRVSGEAGGNAGPLTLNMLERPSSPQQQHHMLADTALDTPHSVSEILDGPGEFNDLMRFLGTEPEDHDIEF